MRFKNRFRCATNYGKGNSFNCKTCGRRGNRKGKKSKEGKTPAMRSEDLKSRSINSEAILSLNIRGFAVKGKFGWVRSICLKERQSIAVFQETRSKSVTDSWVQALWGDPNFGFLQKDAVGKLGGLLVIWDKSIFEVESYTCCEFFLAFRGKWKNNGEKSTIVNVYGPHNDRCKKRMWELLDKLIRSIDTKWLLCGDFNEVRSCSDRFNSQFHQNRADRFNDFISRNSLIEVPISGRKFTRISDDGVKFSKLDRFLVSDGFMSLWANLSVIALDRNLSDHCPLILRDRVLDYGLTPFKVFDEWFNCEEVDIIIKEAWGQEVRGTRKDCAFRDKMKNVKMALKKWSLSRFCSLDNEINELKKKVREWEIKADDNTLSDSERTLWLDCRRRWMEKERVKSNMLRQKAKIKWTLEGDENSKFFHATLRRKYNKCNFQGLLVDGIWHEDPVVVKNFIFSHFQKLFACNSYYRPRILGGFSSGSNLNFASVGPVVPFQRWCGPVGPVGQTPPIGSVQFTEGSGSVCLRISEEEASALEVFFFGGGNIGSNKGMCE
ncbi:uncharacterized protein [Rutidosis leptorrhynchoides]|uniref:uncharacterized protein n=1 Tax=Rutidosis leptorrhynchoides TaxID=125765 RepID=UPI003A993986